MRIISRDLTSQYISASYQDVVQKYIADGSSSCFFLDGLGYSILEVPYTGSLLLAAEQSASMTASWAINAVSASWASASVPDYTSSLFGTASWANRAVVSDAALYAFFADTASLSETMSFDGNRAIKRSPHTGLNVGGNTVVEFLNNFFFPFVSATVSVNSGVTYYETGSSQTITVNGSVTLNDETNFGTGSVERDSVSWNTFTPSTSSASYTFSDIGIEENHSYITYVQVNNNGSPTVISSGTKTVTFIYPFLYGLSTSSSLDSGSLYTELTKSVTTQSDMTINLVGTATFIYFAYPASYGNLLSIIDPNLFNITSDFTATSMSVTSSGLTNNWQNTYKVYKLNNLADPNGDFQFNF